MGALNSTLTPEQVIGGGAVAATIAVSALMLANKSDEKKPEDAPSNASGDKTPVGTTTTASATGGEKKLGKNANRKRKGKVAGGDDGTPAALAAPLALFEPEEQPSPSVVASRDLAASTASTKPKARKRTRKVKAPNAASAAAVNADVNASGDSEDDTNATPEPHPLASSSTSGKGRGFNKFASLEASASPALDASWMHVGKKGGKAKALDASFDASSDAGMATSSVTGDDNSSAAGDTGRMTLAEQFAARQPKTAVDDMLPPEEIARVMRVTSLQEDDMLHSTDADAEEEGWGIVRRKRPNATPSGSTPVTQPPPELTKDQRRREAKKDAEKEAKAAAEADRLKRLAAHRKEQEKAKLDEIDRLAKLTGKGGKLSGGMTPVVQKDGRLVWE